MSVQWRLFVAALRFVTRSAADAGGNPPMPHAATRFVPLIGILIGMIGGAAYWVAAQLWPTSVAVVLALLVIFLATLERDPRPADRLRIVSEVGRNLGTPYWILLIFIKYNTLMALSAAHVPFALPAYVTLGLIMVAGQAASRALLVSMMATDAEPGIRVTTNDLTVALIIGLAPAALLGIPGLVGLAAAIVARLGLGKPVLFKFAPHERLEAVQQVTEVCFYLGALATWKYV